MANELNAAEAASGPDNRWRSEIRLIDQALEEIAQDLSQVGSAPGEAGWPLPTIPVTEIEVALEPVVQVQLRIGESEFAYAEPIDWAERGSQLARSDLALERGDIAALVPVEYPGDRNALIDHLGQSLFVFASDLRDRALAGESMPAATLADLARPSQRFGGWLDWAGHSAIEQAWDSERSRLTGESERLIGERAALIADEAKVAEQLPFIRRRLAEIDKEIGALLEQGDS